MGMGPGLTKYGQMTANDQAAADYINQNLLNMGFPQDLINSRIASSYASFPNTRPMTMGNQQGSPINNMIARANAAATRVNTPTLASLFSGMQSQVPATNPLIGNYTGQFGANRFLGQGVNQLGNPSMMGFSPNTTINK